MKKLIIILFILSLPFISFPQDIQFSHINQTKLYLNPAFAGSENVPSVILGHRNFAPAEFGDYLSYHASYQQYAEILHGGIGFQLISDRQGNGAINRLYSSGTYSYRFQIENNIILQAGLEARFAHLSVSHKNFIYPDMFDPTSWEMSGSSEYSPDGPDNMSGNYLDFNTGAIMTYKNFMRRKYREFTVGLSVHHLNKPTSLLSYQNKKINRRYNLYFDIEIPLMNLRSKNVIPLLTPVVLFEKQGQKMVFNYGSYLKLSSLHLGVFFRHNDKMHYLNGIFYVGVNLTNIRVNYSYDASTLSKMKKNPFSGAHEVTLSINFQYKRDE